MSAREADQIQSLLTRLMGKVRADSTFASEIARAEREFFHANPSALEDDPSARFRFQEWFLLERESERLGAVPVTCIAMGDEDRERLVDSWVGVFQVTGSTAGEYSVEDLQDDSCHDLERIDGLELDPGDVLVGRLFDGSLDVYLPSAVMCCQREAPALAAAFRKDVASLGIDRRLTQAEIEHLLFRGRGQGAPEPLDEGLPLERLEAELERLLERGGVDPEVADATAISAALRAAIRPGLVTTPLLETFAFESEIDIEAVQRTMIQIWDHHRKTTPPPGRSPDQAPQGIPTPAGEDPSGAEEMPALPTETGKAAGSAIDPAILGAEVARRLEDGLARSEDLGQVFAEVERLVGEEPDPVGFRPDAVELNASPDWFEPTDTEDEGDLRPLVTEYLWETEGAAADGPVLEHLVAVASEAPVPQVNLEGVTPSDLMRLLLPAFLSAPPGSRSAAIHPPFASLERFYAWVEETQLFPVQATIAAVRTDLIDQVVRLDAAGMQLSGSATPDPIRTAARDVVEVYAVTDEWIECTTEGRESPVRLDRTGGAHENLREGDILLGTLDIAADGSGSFAGMVLALPAATAELLG